MDDLITASESASLMGVASARGARNNLARWGVQPAPWRSQRGESLYRRSEVEHAIANRPGRGSRTDLRRGKS